MREIIQGMVGSMFIYLVLPDVDLTKAQTVLLLIVGCMVCTALIWWGQGLIERRNIAIRKRKFRRLVELTTLRGERRCG